MNTQPEALRLAAELQACPTINYKDHAAELRRLHAVNQELLEALLLMVAIHDEPAGFVGKYGRALDEAINKQQQKIDARLLKARAAIAKAEGQA